MLKNSFKKIGAVICAFAMVSQLAVIPANAAYINEDQSVYAGDLAEMDSLSLSTDGTDSGSISLNSWTGDYALSFDIVLDGVHAVGNTTKGDEASTFFYFGGSKVGGYLMAGSSTNANGFNLCWKGVNSAGQTGVLQYGQKYNVVCKLTEVGTGAGAKISVYVYDETGATVGTLANGEIRNYSDQNGSGLAMTSVTVKTKAAAGQTASMDVSNIKLYREVGDEIVTTLGGKTLDSQTKTEIELSNIDTTELDFTNVLKSKGTIITNYTTTSSFQMANGKAVPNAIEIKDGKVVADVALPGSDVVGEYAEYDMLLTVAVAEYPNAKIVYPVLFKKAKMLANDLVTNYTAEIKDKSGKTLATGAEIGDDITLDAGSSKVKVEWESSDEDIITSNGVVYPAAEDTEVTLTAKISSSEVDTFFKDELTEDEIAEKETLVAAGTAAWGQVATYTYTVKGCKAIVDTAIAGMKFISNDTADKEIDFTASVNEDFKVPTSYDADKNVKFAWDTEDDANVTLKNGVAILVQKTTDEKEVSITGTISYEKNGQVLYEDEVEKIFTIDMTQEGTADKYIVRCDAAASKNFKDCPEDGDKINSAKDICDGNGLPTEGIFGSEIEWTSSVPKAISNTGKTVKKQSTKKTVNLTATISSGKESATYTIKNLVVPASSSSGGSSGGSSSGSSLNTSVSSTGNRAPAVSYKGTLTPNSSLEQGDITTATVSSFSDLADAAWAREAVTSLYNKGIINGKTASSFAPNDDITRAEFAKIVVKAFGLEDANATVSQFSDVATSDWYYTAVASAYSKGIIKGYENGTFGVNDKITRQDMAVIIYRAAQAAGKSIAAVKDGTVFDDAADIAAYASEAVSVLNKGGIINGMTATTFAPTATATRAQAAQMIYGIVK